MNKYIVLYMKSSLRSLDHYNHPQMQMKKTFIDNETELDQRLQCVEGLLRPLEDGQWLPSQLSPLKPLREDDRQRKRGGRARRTTAVWDK